MDDLPPLPLRTRLMVGFTSLAVGCAGAEGLARLGDGGALPHLALFHQDAGGSIGLRPQASQDIAGPQDSFSVRTDRAGCRVGRDADPSGWLVVGDSQVLGMGVEGEQTFAALGGHHNCGVPGFGVGDAAARAAALHRADTRGVLIVVNQANDWEEGLVPVDERYDVAGGRLIRTASKGVVGRAFWSSPLPRSHLLYYVAMLGMALSQGSAPPPAWLTAPADQGPQTRALAAEVDRLARALQPTPVVAAFLPVDVAAAEERVPSSPFGRYTGGAARPWAETHLRDQLEDALTVARFVDLLPALQGRPDAFLGDDYHLSPDGHARVAAALAPHLEAP